MEVKELEMVGGEGEGGRLEKQIPLSSFPPVQTFQLSQFWVSFHGLRVLPLNPMVS